jgi:hypothetical protein
MIRKEEKMKLNKKIAAGVLSLGLMAGAGSAVSATGNAAGTGGGGINIEQICADPDAALAKMTEHQANIQAKIAKLEKAKVTAQEAGRTKLVARIEKRLAALNERLTKVTGRIANAPAWLAEHCA